MTGDDNLPDERDLELERRGDEALEAAGLRE
jgi:hypothetical protein